MVLNQIMVHTSLGEILNRTLVLILELLKIITILVHQILARTQVRQVHHYQVVFRQIVDTMLHASYLVENIAHQRLMNTKNWLTIPTTNGLLLTVLLVENL